MKNLLLPIQFEEDTIFLLWFKRVIQKSSVIISTKDLGLFAISSG